MRLLALAALLVASLVSFPAHSQSASPGLPSCLPSATLYNIHSLTSPDGHVATIMWCAGPGASINWWGIGGKSTDTLSSGCLTALLQHPSSQLTWLQQAYKACTDSGPPDDTGNSLYLVLSQKWLPRVIVNNTGVPVMRIKAGGNLSQYVFNGVPQTISMPNKAGNHCGGPGIKGSDGLMYYNGAGLATDQGLVLPPNADGTVFAYDGAIPCVILYPPAAGWAN